MRGIENLHLLLKGATRVTSKVVYYSNDGTDSLSPRGAAVERNPANLMTKTLRA